MRWVLVLAAVIVACYLGLWSLTPALASEVWQWVSTFWARMWMLLPISSWGN